MEADKNHAEQNASGWYDTICELVAALEADRKRLEELRDERDSFDPADLEDARINTQTESNAAIWAACNEDDAEELAELEAAVTVDGEELTEDETHDRITEGPLSLDVRSDWHAPGAEPESPSEFCILLSTGEPALRIRGELDQHCQPTRAWMEHQDWGTPWTQWFPADQDTLLTYCQQFYFGE